MADDCERFNNTPPIQAEEYQRLYLRVTRYAPRYLREAAEQLEQMRQGETIAPPTPERLAMSESWFNDLPSEKLLEYYAGQVRSFERVSARTGDHEHRRMQLGSLQYWGEQMRTRLLARLAGSAESVAP